MTTVLVNLFSGLCMFYFCIMLAYSERLVVFVLTTQQGSQLYFVLIVKLLLMAPNLESTFGGIRGDS